MSHSLKWNEHVNVLLSAAVAITIPLSPVRNPMNALDAVTDQTGY
jgi:hypothetical protein